MCPTFSVLFATNLHCMIPILKVDERVVLDFLDAFDFAVPFEQFLQLLLRDVLGEIADIEHLHFRHGLFVGLLLRIGPIDYDVAAPHLDPARAQPTLGQRGGLVGLVFEKTEAAVLLLVIGGAVDDHLDQTGCANISGVQ